MSNTMMVISERDVVKSYCGKSKSKSLGRKSKSESDYAQRPN